MIAERQVAVAPRDNDNRARVKAGRSRIIPASAGLFRLYADYLVREYGHLDSDYVLSGLRDNTYCPDSGIIQRGVAPLPVISVTVFQGAR